MKNIRPLKFFVTLMLLFTLTTLAACAPAAPSGETGGEAASEEVDAAPSDPDTITEDDMVVSDEEVVTIEYWQYFFEARVDAMNELIAQFEAENPNVKVIHNSDIPYDQFRDKIAASAPANVGPDVVTLFYGWLPAWVDAGYLVPLSEEAFPAAMIETEFSPMVANSKFQDQYWAIPTAVRTLALFWNKDLFEAAGLDAETPPSTLAEFVETAQTLTQYDDAGNITQEGFAPAMPGQAHHWFREVLVRQLGGVPYSEDNKTVLWNSEAGCTAFKWLSDLEVVHRTGSNDLFEDATQAFLQGKSALHLDGSFRLGTIAKNAPDLNFGVAELPANDAGEKSTFGSYWTHGLTQRAASDPARMEAAVRFLQFITSPEAGALWVDLVGELPAQLTAAADEDLLADPKLGAFAAGLPYAKATFFADESKQRQHLIDAFDAVRLADEDPCTALNEAAVLEQELLDEFWASH